MAAVKSDAARLQRILVGVDFSPEAEAALAHATQLAQQMSARLILAHIVPLPTEVVEDSTYDPIFRAQIASADLGALHRTQSADLLQDLASRCGQLGLEVESVLVDDNPSDGLARVADEMGADLLVVGTHGRTGLKRVLLGSVAERAVRLAHVNALVARGAVGDEGYQRVLVASDFSSSARAALDMALAVAPERARIEVVHCWQAPVAPAGVPVDPMREELARAVSESGERLLAGRPELRKRVRFVALESSAAEGIRRRAEEEGCDLIVTGSHGRRGVRRWLLGSVTETIIRHAPCSVLVVHEREAEAVG